MKITLYSLFWISYIALMTFGYFVGVSATRCKNDGSPSPILSLSQILSIIARLGFLIWYFIISPWYYALILGIISIFIALGIESKIHGAPVNYSRTESTISMIGFIGWPIMAITSFFLIRLLHK